MSDRVAAISALATGPLTLGEEIDTAAPTMVLEGLAEPAWTTSSLITGARITGTAKRRHERSLNIRILGAIASLATGTIAARALGVVNQPVISAHFGAGTAMDAYFATLALPVLLNNLLVGGLQGAVIPAYTRLMKAGKGDEANRVLSTVLNVVLLLIAAMTALMLIDPAAWVRAMAPGASEATITIGVALAPLIVPVLALNTIVGFLSVLSNATSRFALPAFGAMLVPVGMLAGTLALGNTLGISGLAIGLLGGTVLQFLLMLFLARKIEFRYHLVLDLRDPEARALLAQLWPALFGAAIGQVNPVIDQVVASSLASGSISALNYALKIISIPVTVVFVAYSSAVLPFFSNQVAARDFVGLKKTLHLFTWMNGLLTLGMSIVLTFFAAPVVAIIFRHGAFTQHDAAATTGVLIGFSIGLVPMALQFMINRVFNALQQNKTLLKVSLYTMVTNVALDVVLAHFLGLPGIALATAVDYLLTTILLLALLRSRIGPLGLLRPPPQLLEMLAVPLRGYVRPRAGWKLPSTLAPLGATPTRALRNGILVSVTFLGVAAISAKSTVQGARLSAGLTLALIFLRSPYGLLLTWAAAGAFYDIYLFGHSIGFILALGSLPAFAVMLWNEWRQNNLRVGAILAYGGFLLWVALTMTRSPVGLRQFGIDWLGFLDYALVFLLARSQLTTRARFERFVTVMLMMSTALSVLGLLQYIFRFGGYQTPDAPAIYRVSSIFGWSSSLAFYLVLIIPLAIYRALSAPRGRRLFWFLALLLHITALVLTFSREAYVGVIVTVFVAATLLNGRMRIWLLRGLVVGLLLFLPALAIRSVRDRLTFGLDTLNARTYGWSTLVSHLHLLDPLGQGLFSSIALLQRLHPDGVVAPHSLYLQVLFDHGVVGLMLLLTTFFLLLRGAIRVTLRCKGHARLVMALIAGGIAGAFCMVGVDNAFWDFSLGIYFWLVAALPFAPVFSVTARAASVSGPLAAADAADTSDTIREIPPLPASSSLPAAPSAPILSRKRKKRS